MDILEAATNSRPRKIGRKGRADIILAAHKQLLAELAEIQARAHRLGLHKAGHALREALNVAGFEAADFITGTRKP